MKHVLKDPSRLRGPPKGFQCGENVEEGEVGSVNFYFTLPDGARLDFSCRGRSVGVLLKNEPDVADEELESEIAVDPFFFDDGYTLAGRTGFQV